MVMKVVGKVGEEKDVVVEVIRDLLKLLEKEFVGKDFFGGESLGFVDIVVMLVVFWLMRMEEVVGVKVVLVEMFLEIYRWVKNFLDVDVIKKCIFFEDEYFDYIRVCMESFKFKLV